MTSKLASMETFSFDGENIGASGASALRKVKSLADNAPVGRLFASIATLTEMSATTAKLLEEGNLQKASRQAAAMADAGEPKLPTFIRRKA
jgi:hypothetical protein